MTGKLKIEKIKISKIGTGEHELTLRSEREKLGKERENKKFFKHNSISIFIILLKHEQQIKNQTNCSLI